MTNQLELPESNYSPTEVKKAYVAILITLLMIAFMPILLRISGTSITPNATIFNRFWIATVVLGLWNGVLIVKRRSLPSPTETLQNSAPIKLFPDFSSFLLLLILAIMFVGFQLFWAWSLTQTSVANSEVLHSVTPLFTTLLGWSLFGQKFDRLFLSGVAIALSGSILLVANDFSIALDKLEGDLLALLSALFWAGYLLIVEKLQTKLSITAIITWICVLGTFLCLPILLVARGELFPHSWQGWLTLIILGMAIILVQGLISYSLKWLSSGLVATILLLNPILTSIFAWIIFSETLNLLNFLGFFIILLGIYLTISSEDTVKSH
ncbi:MAG: DMT family transporter [Okeania sp. SIO3I5]|uniref:DMT family transporter n=1 Tax=Okeania sp. SIO3I5 TaxID=2607805 RepID=UPI0013B95BBD|nr:DMT family transporter [Okeania sp. SIO3I5]NEQ41363.1 DMT family transporter [Okeania sp. SIO3I5]